MCSFFKHFYFDFDFLTETACSTAKAPAASSYRSFSKTESIEKFE